MVDLAQKAELRSAIEVEFGVSLEAAERLLTSASDAQDQAIYVAPLPGLPGDLLPTLDETVFEAVPFDATMRPRSIEQNLDDVTNYAKLCRHFANEYYEVGQRHIDRALKYIEFAVLDNLHGAEIDAGVFRQSLIELSGEEAAMKETLRELELQQAVVKSVLDNNLSDKERSDIGSAEGSVSAMGRKGQEYTDVLRRTEASVGKRLAIERKNWEATSHALASSIAGLQARQAATTLRREFAEQDVTFRTHRDRVAVGLGWEQIQEWRREGSILNEGRRLKAIKAQYEECYVKMVGKAKLANMALQTVYGFPDTLGTPKAGEVLGAIELWLIGLQDALGEHKRRHIVEIFQIPVSLTGQSGEVDIQPSMTGGSIGLLRGILIEHIGPERRPMSVKMTAPGTVADFRGITTFNFGRVVQSDPGGSASPQLVDQSWNGDPYGKWSFTTDDTAPGGVLILYLFLAMPR